MQFTSRDVQFTVVSAAPAWPWWHGRQARAKHWSADGNNAGNLYELDAILAVVLGGTSLNGGKYYLLGSMIGALIIQTLTTTIYAFNVAPEISQVVKALVVYGVSLLQSETIRRRITGAFGKG